MLACCWLTVPPVNGDHHTRLPDDWRRGITFGYPTVTIDEPGATRVAMLPSSAVSALRYAPVPKTDASRSSVLDEARASNRTARIMLANLALPTARPSITTLALLISSIRADCPRCLPDPGARDSPPPTAAATGMNSTWILTRGLAAWIWLSACKVGGTECRRAASALAL